MRKVSTIKIGKKIKAIRRSYGYTQEMLAEIVEVSSRYISEIEQDRAKPSYEVLVKICNIFSVSMDQIFSEYLNINENKNIDYSLPGFYKLSKKDQSTIENLIMYFNKSKLNDVE